MRIDEPLENAIEVEQVFVSSPDGTKVPMFIIRSKDGGDAPRPTIIYGYGGFGVSMFPYYSPRLLDWVKRGGTYAIPSLRGGMELGYEWYVQATLKNKHKTFQDFIAASEFLIDNRYTTAEQLAAWGGSNGGLTVLASMVDRPELFGAVVADVPVTDLVHIHKSPGGPYWVNEYGDVNKPDEFENLLSNSPYHQVQETTNYPAVLILGAENDSRVDPSQGYKMAARLQEASTSDKPVLLSVKKNIGHGVGRSATQATDGYTQIFTFLENTIKSE